MQQNMILDVDKIMSLPLSERDEEICKQVADLLQSKEGSANLIGMIGSLVANQMIQMEYMNVLSSAINGICNTARIPVAILDFADFIETHDHTDEQRAAWLKQKNDEWMRQREAARKRASGLVDVTGKKL